MDKKKIRILISIFVILFIIGIVSIVIINLKKDKELKFLKDEEVILVVGDKLYLNTNERDKDTNYSWSSSNENVVIVSKDGEIEAISVGEAFVKVKYNDTLEKCKIIVKDINQAIQTKNITLKETEKSIKIGEKFKLNYSIEPENATNKSVTYYSSNENVVIIEDENVVGVGAGEAVVSVVTADGNIAFCSVVVKKGAGESAEKEEISKIEVESIAFDKKEITVNLNDTYQLKYVINPTNAETNVIWNSSDKKIVSISGDGMIIARKVGTAIITINTLNGKSDSIKINVVKPIIDVSSVSFGKDNLNVIVGDRFELVANVNPSNATNKSLSYTSSDNTIVSVDKNGVIKAQKVGTAIVSVISNNDKKDTITIKVLDKKIDVTGIEIDKKEATLDVGEKLQLNELYIPSNATRANVEWSSSDEKIAVVNENGLVTAKGKGTVKIVAKVGSKTASSTINVIKLVTGISLSKSVVNLNVGDGYNLVATVLPTDASDKKVTYTSSNPNIAIVSNSGLIKGLKKGSCEVIVKASNGKTAKVVVNVSEVPLSSISFDTKDKTLSVGDTWKINTTLKPSNVTNKSVTWKSGTPSVATINSDGLITARSGGGSTITATSGGKSVSIKITVKNYNLIVDNNNFLTVKENSTSIIRSKSNTKVTLRGFNLGVYLSRSLAFMPIEPLASSKEELESKGYSCINSVAFIQALERNENIKNRAKTTGRSASLIAQDLSNILYNNYITEEDFDLIAQTGANVIRLPFEYGLFLYENPKNGQFSYSETRAKAAFKRIDWVIEQCKKRGIYVILDFHLAPGRQNSGGWCSEHTFFKNTNYQNASVYMWKKIAERYKDEEAVAGYDILNEPEGTTNAIVSFYDSVYKAIRSVDNNHIIFMEETCVLCGYSGVNRQDVGSLPDPDTKGWKNVVYSTHDYFYQTTSTNSTDDKLAVPVDVMKERIKKKTDKTINKMNTYKVPYYIGEFSHLGTSLGDASNYKNYLSVWEYAMDYYDKNGLSYTPWTYKGNHERYYGLVYYGKKIERVNIETATYEQIKTTFSTKSNSANRFNKEYYQMFLEQWGGRLGTKIKLDCSNVSLSVGSSKTINYTITPNTTIQKKVVWGIEKGKDIVKIDKNTGKITGIKKGKAVIKATLKPLILEDSSKNVVAKCEIEVK